MRIAQSIVLFYFIISRFPFLIRSELHWIKTITNIFEFPAYFLPFMIKTIFYGFRSPNLTFYLLIKSGHIIKSIRYLNKTFKRTI